MSTRVYLLSCSKKLWDELASDAEREGLILMLDTFSKLDDLPLPSLKKVVQRTFALCETWHSRSPSKCLERQTIAIPRTFRVNHSRSDSIILTRDYLVVSLGYGQVICFNRKTKKCIGLYSPPSISYSHDQSWCGRSLFMVYVIPRQGL